MSYAAGCSYCRLLSVCALLSTAASIATVSAIPSWSLSSEGRAARALMTYEDTVEVRTGEQLILAAVNPVVRRVVVTAPSIYMDMPLIHRVVEQIPASLPVQMAKNFTIEGDSRLPSWPMLTSMDLKDVFRLDVGCTLAYTRVFISGVRDDYSPTQIPGLDILAVTNPTGVSSGTAAGRQQTSRLLLQNATLIIPACFDAAMMKAYIESLVPFQENTYGVYDGNKFDVPLPQDGCSNNTSLPPDKRCWPMKGHLANFVFRVANPDPVAGGYTLWNIDTILLDVDVLCRTVVDEDCTRALGTSYSCLMHQLSMVRSQLEQGLAAGAAGGMLPPMEDTPRQQQQEASSNATSLPLSSPSMAGSSFYASVVEGFLRSRDDGSKQGGEGIPVGAVVGATLGSVVVVALGLALFVVFRRMRHRRQRFLSEEGAFPSAASGPSAAVVDDNLGSGHFSRISPSSDMIGGGSTDVEGQRKGSSSQQHTSTDAATGSSSLSPVEVSSSAGIGDLPGQHPAAATARTSSCTAAAGFTAVKSGVLPANDSSMVQLPTKVEPVTTTPTIWATARGDSTTFKEATAAVDGGVQIVLHGTTSTEEPPQLAGAAAVAVGAAAEEPAQAGPKVYPQQQQPPGPPQQLKLGAAKAPRALPMPAIRETQKASSPAAAAAAAATASPKSKALLKADLVMPDMPPRSGVHLGVQMEECLAVEVGGCADDKETAGASAGNTQATASASAAAAAAAAAAASGDDGWQGAADAVGRIASSGRQQYAPSSSAPPPVVHLTTNTLGKGAFGRVVEGSYRGERVAVKIVAELTEDTEILEAVAKSFMQDVQVLSRCHHPNVIRLLAACAQPPRLCLVMELMDTSLDKVLYGGTSSGLAPGELMPLSKVLYVGAEVARALAYLHPTVVHRDLKPGNVLLRNPASDRPEVKLTDFGLARLRTTLVPTKHPDAGTPPYMAPECFDVSNHVISHKADIYSLGVLLWEMLAGTRPWAGIGVVAIAFTVTLQNQRPPLEAIPTDRLSSKLLRLLRQCWDADPQRRPGADEIAKELTLAHQQLQQQLATTTMTPPPHW